MLAWVLLRLARIWGDDELERHAVSVFRLVEPTLRRAPGRSRWMLCALDLWFSAAAGARDRRRRSTARSRGRR